MPASSISAFGSSTICLSLKTFGRAVPSEVDGVVDQQLLRLAGGAGHREGKAQFVAQPDLRRS